MNCMWQRCFTHPSNTLQRIPVPDVKLSYYHKIVFLIWSTVITNIASILFSFQNMSPRWSPRSKKNIYLSEWIFSCASKCEWYVNQKTTSNLHFVVVLALRKFKEDKILKIENWNCFWSHIRIFGNIGFWRKNKRNLKFVAKKIIKWVWRTFVNLFWLNFDTFNQKNLDNTENIESTWIFLLA